MKAVQNRGRGKLKSKLAAVLIAASLLLLLGTIGCSHSKPSIVGKWQKAPGQTVGIGTDYLYIVQNGLEFFPDGTVDIKGLGAQGYAFPDSSHIRISTNIYKFSMSGDEFTLTADNDQEPSLAFLGSWEVGAHSLVFQRS